MTGVRPDGVSLQWERPRESGNCKMLNYIVVMKETDQEKFKKVMKVAPNQLSCVVAKVKEGHEYDFRVYAENEAGISKEFSANVGSVLVPLKSLMKDHLASSVLHTNGQSAQVPEEILFDNDLKQERLQVRIGRENLSFSIAHQDEHFTTLFFQVKNTDNLKSLKKTSDIAPEFATEPSGVSVAEGETIKISTTVTGCCFIVDLHTPNSIYQLNKTINENCFLEYFLNFSLQSHIKICLEGLILMTTLNFCFHS